MRREDVVNPNKRWQLRMFDRSLKKKLKLRALLRHLAGNAASQRLLVTCGDNNGATNYHLRSYGGNWTWADLETECLAEMQAILGEKVHLIDRTDPKFPFSDGQFDLVVTIDVHEHLESPMDFTRELFRVTRPGGSVIATTPGGDPERLINRLKSFLGMRPDVYGHVRLGFTIEELQDLLRSSGLRPLKSSTYSGFFTELLELMINFAYVKVLSGGAEDGPACGSIAPSSQERFSSVRKSYRVYSVLYPIFWAISRLDYLLVNSPGHAVVVEARR